MPTVRDEAICLRQLEWSETSQVVTLFGRTLFAIRCEADNSFRPLESRDGFKGAAGPLGYDIGLLYYYYPGSNLAGVGTIDNLEVYAGVSWKFLSLKYFHAVSDFFGAPNTDGSNYIDFGATWDLGQGWGLNGHIGHQKVENIANADYTDYKLGITKDLSGWVFGAAFIDTDAENSAYTFTNAASGKTVNVGDSTVVLSVSKTF